LVINVVASRRRADRSAALVGANQRLVDRAVNPHLPPPYGFVDGAKKRRQQLHRVNNRKKQSIAAQRTQKKGLFEQSALSEQCALAPATFTG
jgi:hypothetical protein